MDIWWRMLRNLIGIYAVVWRRSWGYFAQTSTVEVHRCCLFANWYCPRYAVWFGGSLLASLVSFNDCIEPISHHLLMSCFQPDFYTSCHTKAQYDEIGPSICRRYQIFGSATWPVYHRYIPTSEWSENVWNLHNRWISSRDNQRLLSTSWTHMYEIPWKRQVERWGRPWSIDQ